MGKISDAADKYMSEWVIEEGNMQFKLGDVVVLKSGGPDMTISELTDDGFIVVAWFGHGDVPNFYKFEPEMLELAVDEDGFYEDIVEPELSTEELDALVAQSEYYKRDRGH